MKNRNGFTIVELLIVIVVIGILAAITIVTFNGIQSRARDESRHQAMTSWVKIFSAYRAVNESWPSTMSPGNYYCLGTGFPIGAGGIARCSDYNSSSGGLPESNSQDLMEQLNTVGTVNTPPRPVDSRVVGPYVYLSVSTGDIEITNVFSPSLTACPDGTVNQYYGGDEWYCEIRLKAE